MTTKPPTEAKAKRVSPDDILARAIPTLVDFAILHAGLVLSTRIDGWRGATPMAKAAKDARDLIGVWERATGKKAKARRT